MPCLHFSSFFSKIKTTLYNFFLSSPKKEKQKKRMQQGMNPLLNTSPTSSSSSQIPFNPHSQIQFHDPIASSSSSEDFLDHMLSTIPHCSWSDLSETPPSLQDNTDNNNTTSNNNNNNNVNQGPGGFHGFDESAILASKLRQHQISGGTSAATAAVAKLMLQQQLLMASRAGGVSQNDCLVDGSPFKSPTQGGEGLYNGFGGGSLAPTHSQQQQQFHHPQAQNFGGSGSAAVMNQQQQAQASGSTSGGGGVVGSQQQPKQRVRARRGQATDPHSIAERLRRERIAERMKSLQELVPNANKTDKASMLDEIIDYVKFLQLQVKVLSMSRLGGAAAVSPLVADMSSEGGAGVDGIQASANGGSLTHNSNQTASSNDNITVTEHQVAKLMEEDMGSAMQYLQGKGLCLMPISLASAISTATCHGRIPVISNNNGNGHQLHQSNSEGPSSPNFSVLTVQSATFGNGVCDGSVKDAASISKP